MTLQTGPELATRIELLPKHWDLAGSSNAAPGARGIHLPASDWLITTLAHHGKVPFLAKDPHFAKIHEYSMLELRIFAPNSPSSLCAG